MFVCRRNEGESVYSVTGVFISHIIVAMLCMCKGERFKNIRLMYVWNWILIWFLKDVRRENSPTGHVNLFYILSVAVDSLWKKTIQMIDPKMIHTRNVLLQISQLFSIRYNFRIHRPVKPQTPFKLSNHARPICVQTDAAQHAIRTNTKNYPKFSEFHYLFNDYHWARGRTQILLRKQKNRKSNYQSASLRHTAEMTQKCMVGRRNYRELEFPWLSMCIGIQWI